jgi:hypothetical protein
MKWIVKEKPVFNNIYNPKNETSTTLRVVDFLRDLYAKLLGTALDATYLTYRSYASNRPW